MIRIFFISLPFIFLGACRSDKRPSTPEETPITEAPASETTVPGSSAGDVRIPFAGDWISKDYFDKVTSDKSPRKAQEGSEDCFIHIPPTPSQTTSMVYNFHEAGPQLVAIQKNGTYRMWEKVNDNLVQVIYTIDRIADDKIKIGDKTFLKINPIIDNNQPRILEEILFKGKYQLKTGQQVEFKKNGEVTGLDGYRYYAPVIDYFDAGLQVDQVGLGMAKDQLEYFGFKFKGNTLDLYKLKCKTYDEMNKRCLDVTFGERVIQLSKIEGGK
jgi:hypothetical protein